MMDAFDRNTDTDTGPVCHTPKSPSQDVLRTALHPHSADLDRKQIL